MDIPRKLLEYLQYYKYLPEDLGDIRIKDIQAAVTRLQEFAGLTVDGVAGPKTLNVIAQPRCGCADIAETRSNVRKWGKKDLTYYISRRDTDLSSSVWDDIMAQGLKAWSDVAQLTFSRRNTSHGTNLILSVGTGRRDSFDGPSGTLAWAQLPGHNYQGQLLMRFDTGETWISQDSNRRGVRLLNVATHEFGHMLGLTHSNDQNALMAPYYKYQVVKPQADDICRIQGLYGGRRPDPTPPPRPKPKPDSNETIITIQGNIEDIDITGYRTFKR